MKVILTFMSALAAVAVSAQDLPRNVEGRVTDAMTGEPIPYASVHLEGTMLGTSTDGEGIYEITVPSDGILVFSSIGYKTREIPVEGKSAVNAALEPDMESLEETIVIAYGTATKSSFTGSASMVDAQTIESRVSTDVTSALAGTTPGVQVISSSGDPASSGQMRLFRCFFRRGSFGTAKCRHPKAFAFAGLYPAGAFFRCCRL